MSKSKYDSNNIVVLPRTSEDKGPPCKKKKVENSDNIVCNNYNNLIALSGNPRQTIINNVIQKSNSDKDLKKCKSTSGDGKSKVCGGTNMVSENVPKGSVSLPNTKGSTRKMTTLIPNKTSPSWATNYLESIGLSYKKNIKLSLSNKSIKPTPVTPPVYATKMGTLKTNKVDVGVIKSTASPNKKTINNLSSCDIFKMKLNLCNKLNNTNKNQDENVKNTKTLKNNNKQLDNPTSKKNINKKKVEERLKNDLAGGNIVKTDKLKETTLIRQTTSNISKEIHSKEVNMKNDKSCSKGISLNRSITKNKEMTDTIKRKNEKQASSEISKIKYAEKKTIIPNKTVGLDKKQSSDTNNTIDTEVKKYKKIKSSVKKVKQLKPKHIKSVIRTIDSSKISVTQEIDLRTKINRKIKYANAKNQLPPTKHINKCLKHPISDKLNDTLKRTTDTETKLMKKTSPIKISKPCNKIKLIINFKITQSQEQSKEIFDEQDLSFLDDINIDEIVESLDHCNRSPIITNIDENIESSKSKTDIEDILKTLDVCNDEKKTNKTDDSLSDNNEESKCMNLVEILESVDDKKSKIAVINNTDINLVSTNHSDESSNNIEIVTKLDEHNNTLTPAVVVTELNDNTSNILTHENESIHTDKATNYLATEDESMTDVLSKMTMIFGSNSPATNEIQKEKNEKHEMTTHDTQHGPEKLDTNDKNNNEQENASSKQKIETKAFTPIKSGNKENIKTNNLNLTTSGDTKNVICQSAAETNENMDNSNTEPKKLDSQQNINMSESKKVKTEEIINSSNLKVTTTKNMKTALNVLAPSSKQVKDCVNNKTTKACTDPKLNTGITNKKQPLDSLNKVTTILHDKLFDKYMISNLENRMSSYLGTQYTLISHIHKGKYSDILKVKSSEGNHLALKVKCKSTPYAKSKAKMLLKLQYEIPKANFNCIYLHESFSWFKHCCLLMEYYPRNLQEALNERSKPFHIDLVQILARQLISAVTILRNNNIVHSDIKPTHVLINNACNKIKLCGFDEACYALNFNILPNVGTSNYRAPEIIIGYNSCFSIDVWASALVLYEMSTKTKLFPHTYNNRVLFQQMCLFGPLSPDMLRNSSFGKHHFNKDFFFMLKWGLRGENSSPILKFSKPRNTLSTLIFQAYYQHWASSRFQNADQDLIKIQMFVELLEKMLIMHPKYRLSIEFAFANPFIYEIGDTEFDFPHLGL